MKVTMYPMLNEGAYKQAILFQATGKQEYNWKETSNK